MKEIFNKQFKNKEEINFFLKNIYGFSNPSKKEIENWPYKGKLGISPKELIGRRVYDREKYCGVIKKVSYEKNRNHNSIVFYSHMGDKVSISNARVEFENYFSDEAEFISIHPTRGGKLFWEKGFIIAQYDYKKLYYQTEEYRIGYEKKLNENHGTVGLKAPIQNKKIKEKISNTINERYGVDWFLDRGKHYSAVTLSMLANHGVENVFFSEDWQIKMHKIKNDITIVNCKANSNLEIEVVKKLNEIFFHEDNFFYESTKGQYYLKSFSGNNTFYMLDFYNPVRKIVVEVMGDYWHCNPELYGESFCVKQKNKTAKDIWTYDALKKAEIIRTLKCFYFQIWEHDWNVNKNNILEQLQKEFILWEQSK